MGLKYKHLIGEDKKIWERFLVAHGDKFGRYEFDVHIGTPVKPPDDMPEPYKSMAEGLSQYRIDVVGTTPDTIYIIEVKFEAGMSAMGQVLGYVSLYKRDFKPDKPVVPILITDAPKPDARYYLDLYGVQLIIV